MRYEPSPYQEYATKFILSTPRCALFLDMGLGKTVITLTALSSLLATGECERVLVIAPLNVARTVWKEEVQKWDHTQGIRCVKVLGSAQERRAALRREADVYVINRENTKWLIEQYAGGKWPFDTIVIDELSSFKGSNTERFRALRSATKLRKTKHVIGLTGTPASNGYLDLWAQMFLIDNGERLGTSITRYREKYFVPLAQNGYVVYKYGLLRGAKQEIDERIRDIVVSMSAQDWLSMPERIMRTVPVELPQKALRAYQSMEKELLLNIDEQTITAANAAVVMGKLLQITGGAVYDGDHEDHIMHNAKIDALREIVDVAQGNILVFYAYRHELERLLREIPGAVKLEGAKQIEAWNRGEVRVLLAHPDSAGHGLNLQAGGHVVVWYSLTWSLEKYQQANARLWRRGQQETVIIHHLVAKGTVDETVMSALEGKDMTQQGLLQAVRARKEIVYGQFQRDRRENERAKPSEDRTGGSVR